MQLRFSMLQEDFKAWLAAILVGLLWGTPWILGLPVIQRVDEGVLVCLQYLFAALTLSIFAASKRIQNRQLSTAKPRYRQWQFKDLFWFVVSGFIGQFLFSYLSYVSLRHISGSENGIIQGLVPILILLVGYFRHNTPISSLQSIAALAAFFGVCILVESPNSSSHGFNLYHAICFFSAASFSCNAYVREYLAAKYGAIESLQYQFYIAAIGGFVVLNGLHPDLHSYILALTTPLILSRILLIGVFISGISYIIYLYASRRIGVNNVGMALNLMPLSSFVLAVIVLHETVTPMRLSAMLIVLFSMVLVVYQSQNKVSRYKK